MNLEALGPVTSERRHVRRLLACAVCAGIDWETEREYVYMWSQGEDAAEKSFIQEPSREGRRRHSNEATGDAAPPQRSPREQIARFFSCERFASRWRFWYREGRDYCTGGIPLQELQDSAVRDPDSGELWLLHRKCFEFERRWCQGRVQEVARRDQKVPICACCRAALSKKEPTMPKFALANDFWMGKLPAILRDLTEGAWLLLALVRPLIRRYSCLNDSGKWMDHEERIKGYIGNVTAFAQADGGQLLESLPPRASDLVKSIAIAFTGSTADLRSARVEPLGFPVEVYRKAYNFYKKHNYVCGTRQQRKTLWLREKC